MTVSSHTYIHAGEHPKVQVTHGFMRTTVAISDDNSRVVIRGTQQQVEGFLVQLLADFHRPLVAAMRPDDFCEALPCPCGGRGPCCTGTWNDESDGAV